MPGSLIALYFFFLLIDFYTTHSGLFDVITEIINQFLFFDILNYLKPKIDPEVHS